MTNINTERRQQPRKKLTTRLLWHVTCVSLALLILTLMVTFWQTYPAAKRDVVTQLQSEVAVKLQANQIHLQGVERQGELLAREFLARYQAFNDDPKLQDDFYDWFDETSPGVWRLQEAFFTSVQRGEHLFKGMSVFVGPQKQPLNDELRARLVISVRTLNELGPAWQELVTNTHLSLPENALAMYSTEQAWGRLAAADLVMTDYSTLRSTLQSENPERQPNWTGLYKDHSAGYWTITYQRPVDLNGKHLVNASFDVSLAQLTRDLSRTVDENIESYVLNAQGALVASSTFSAELSEQRDTLTPENYDDPLYQKIAARLVDHSSNIEQEVWDDIDEDYLVLVQHLGTPEWWYFSIYPKALITNQALYLPYVIAFVGSMLVTAVLLTMAYFVQRQVSRPLTQLAATAALMTEKNYQAIEEQKISRAGMYGEVAQVLQAFRVMAQRFVKANAELEQRVDERTQELHQANRKLDELVHIDGLTGLLNRRAFQTDLAEAVANANNHCYFVMADIDDFKPFNDNYGHEAGDRALVAFATAFQKLPNSRSYRYGGEEFAMLLQAESLAQAEQQLEQLRTRIHQLGIEHKFGRRLGGVLTISFGITQIKQSEPPSELIQRADKNMYRAKQAGGDEIIS
ncbi:diguanylate cyclase domain-containing protein [Pseudidiomarina homiensis]|uniref:diguanylate cyclase domain-containing protein n=1 Tax=Pseudidiomarina homiensis TaxID=364198 RepID=UPI00215A0DFF|nr:diguanylate cyclase [Pseudidiomarina homiensis]